MGKKLVIGMSLVALGAALGFFGAEKVERPRKKEDTITETKQPRKDLPKLTIVSSSGGIEPPWKAYFSKDYQTAAVGLSDVVKTFDQGYIHAMIGYCHEKLGNIDAAIISYEKAQKKGLGGRDQFENLRSNKKYVIFRKGVPELQELGSKANNFIDEKKYEDGIKVAEEMIQKYPDNFYGYCMMGTALMYKHDFDNAQQYFQEAIFRRPEEFRLRLLWVRAFLELGFSGNPYDIREKLLGSDEKTINTVMDQYKIVLALNPNDNRKKPSDSGMLSVWSVMQPN